MRFLFMFLYISGITMGAETCEIFPETPDGVIVDRGTSFNATLLEIKPIAARGTIGNLAPMVGLRFEVTLPLSSKRVKKPIVIVPLVVSTSLQVGGTYKVVTEEVSAPKSWRQRYPGLPKEYFIPHPCIDQPIRPLSK